MTQIMVKTNIIIEEEDRGVAEVEEKMKSSLSNSVRRM